MQDPFASLAEPERRRLHAAMRRRRFRRDEVVCHQGDPGNSLHVVVRGRFVATIASPLTGQTAAINVFPPRSVFGELAVLGAGAERTATISALEAAETLELHRADFEQLMADHPAVQRFVLEAMAERLSDMTAQLSEALFVMVDKRVHRRLLFLHDLALVSGDEWIVLRQEEVAMMAGTTRPTVNRVLRRAAADDVIELGRGRMRVLDRSRLARLACLDLHVHAADENSAIERFSRVR